MNDKEVYAHTESCSNCSVLRVYHIPKGTTINSYMSKTTCIHCGCPVRTPAISFKLGTPDSGGAIASRPYNTPIDVRYVMGVALRRNA